METTQANRPAPEPRGEPPAGRGLRVALALLVLGLYFVAWRPARPYFVRHVARPVLAAAAPGPGAAVRLVAGGDGVEVTAARARAPMSYRAPAGVRFLLAGLFLAVASPRRSDWLMLWGLHIAAGGAALLLLAGAVQWGVGIGLYRFWTGQGIDLFSLLVPLWMVVRAREGRFLPPGNLSGEGDAETGEALQ